MDGDSDEKEFTMSFCSDEIVFLKNALYCLWQYLNNELEVARKKDISSDTWYIEGKMHYIDCIYIALYNAEHGMEQNDELPF